MQRSGAGIEACPWNGATEDGIEDDHKDVETLSTILALYCTQLENNLVDDTMMFQGLEVNEEAGEPVYDEFS